MTIWTLLVIYQLKHFLADYLLQGKYMLGKFRDKGWVLPLLAHVAVHGAFTACIACIAGRPWLALPLAVLDAGIHFVMDRIKAGNRYLGRFKPLTAAEYISCQEFIQSYREKPSRYLKTLKDSEKRLRGNTLFWWSLGLDQMVHHLTHYACIAILVIA